ncbi:MAG TPA: carboxypeptidase-like regulatory domain-containing protein, partial [Terriglobia bacterium]|nr:carboxypeptidase-like regulatory domain-containing protein [Terriglobia bacterium]
MDWARMLAYVTNGHHILQEFARYLARNQTSPMMYFHNQLLVALMLLGGSPVTTQHAYAGNSATWQGILRTTDGSRISDATVELKEIQTGMKRRRTTAKDGLFLFEDLPSAQCSVTVSWQQRAYAFEGVLDFTAGNQRTGWLELNLETGSLKWRESPLETRNTGSVKEQLSSQEVSELPLNKRDFSQLLLLAAGTTTDTNG